MTFIDGHLVNLHHENRLHLDPEWIVVGVRISTTGEYAALAGIGLTEATLTSRARQVVDLIDPNVSGPTRVEELTAKIGNYLIGFGPSYAEALNDLIQHWNPDDTSHDRIE